MDTSKKLNSNFNNGGIIGNQLPANFQYPDFPYQIAVLDFETYYDKEYSLSKITMEEYIRDPRFEVIMVGVRMLPGEKKRVITGTHDEIKYALEDLEFEGYALLAHNTLFDGAILSWVFGIKPAFWLDTLSMARAMFGGKGNSLASLAEKYNLENKGTYVINALGKRRKDFTLEEFQHYAEYCLLDVDLCAQLFHLMYEGWYNTDSYDGRRHPFPHNELRLIDAHIRMFTEPKLVLNNGYLKQHLSEVKDRKEQLLKTAAIEKDLLMSNNKFAEVLRGFGVDPPKKISITTGKEAFAFAKTDAGMKALWKHEDERVQAVAAARMGVKSTLEETRTERFIAIAGRGGSTPVLPVPLRYCAAHTKRSGGTDKINLQNVASRGAAGGKLKRGIEAPKGYVLIDCDSSQIEARMLAWLARQDDLVRDFANGVDVYCGMATDIYDKEVTKKDPLERFVGKTVILGAGYQTGAAKLQNTLRIADPPVIVDIEECDRIIKAYRRKYRRIQALWYEGDECVETMHKNQTRWFGRAGVAQIDGHNGVKLPSGLYISYPGLHFNQKEEQWMYKSDNGLTNLYGGKLTENVVQALARIVVMLQLLKIRRKLPVVLTVHDSILALAREDEKEEARKYVEECMRWVPKWAIGCPINCESKMGYNYGFKD